MQSLFDPPSSVFSDRFPPPPSVPWWVLFIVFAVLNAACFIFLPASIRFVVPSLIPKFWGLYLCLWIRSLNPAAKSIYWFLGSVVCSSIAILFTLFPAQTVIHGLGTVLFAPMATVTGIVSYYIIRSDLERHYNEQEPVGLTLGPVMTFFFGYLYFQYHLYDIAQSKRMEQESIRA